jgi:alpha-N-acetylglucosamine transferase
MSNESPATELPDEDVRGLQGLNVKIRYIPKSAHESFYATVMQKFRILSLTEYRRVILMDGDVMPLTNLDYIFEMSDGENATLKENLVIEKS